MPYAPILTTLAYVVSGDRVLLCHRTARPGDEQLGKYNGLGGKVERDEDVVAGMRRELAEEAGLVPTKMRLAGTISWPGFGPNGEDVLGFVFVVTGFEGEVPARNAEGELAWHPIAVVGELDIWEGDRYFLPWVFAADARQFHAVIPYSEGHPIGCRVSWL